MSSFIIECSGCGQKNRVDLRADPACGRCKQPLAGDLADVIMKVAESRHARDAERVLEDLAVG